MLALSSWPVCISVECFCFVFSAMPCGLWDLSSPTRDWTWAPTVKAQSPNHWTARDYVSGVFMSFHKVEHLFIYLRAIFVFLFVKFLSYSLSILFLQRLKKIFFNWKIIVLQNCVGFCQTSTWISHRYTFGASLLTFPLWNITCSQKKKNIYIYIKVWEYS